MAQSESMDTWKTNECKEMAITSIGDRQQSKRENSNCIDIKMIYTEFVYSIWIERNMRMFEKVHRNSDSIARDIVCACSVRAPTKVREIVHAFRFQIALVVEQYMNR